MIHLPPSIVAFALAVLVCQALPAADYHFSNAGDDAADGLTPTTAWKSLAKVPAMLLAGDRVLLRCGDTWRDCTLPINGTGSAEQPIVVGSYGAGDRPLLIWDNPNPGSNANVATGIDVRSGGWLTVRGLEVRRAVFGLRLTAPTDGSRWEGLRVEDCFFHDNIVSEMRGDPDVGDDYPMPGWKEGQPPPKKWGPSSGAAILIMPPPLRFAENAPETLPLIRGLVVANNIGFENNQFLMAKVGSDYNTPMGKGLEVVGNTVAFGNKNQMLLLGWDGSRVHRNVMVYNGSRRYFGLGLTSIMVGHQRNCVYEENELAWQGETESSRGPAKDGCGFDWENPSSGSSFRRNFVHDCLGEGLLTMGDKPDATARFGRLTIADNLFAYNARYSTRHHQELSLNNISADFQVLNNTFFLRSGIAKTKYNKRGKLTEQGSTVHQGVMTHRDPQFAPQPRVSALTVEPGLRRLRFAAIPGAELRYTTDGSLPMPDSPLLPESVEFRRSGALNVTAFMAGRQRSPVSSHIIDLHDRSGSAPLHHLTAPGAPLAELGCPTWRLDGTAPQLDAPALATPTNEFSISCWVKPDAALHHDPATPMDWRSFAALKFQPKTPPPFALAAVDAAHLGAGHAGLGLAVGANGIGVYERGKDHLACLVVDHLTPITGWTHVVVTVRERTPRLWIDGEFRRVGSATRMSLHPSLRLADGFRGGIADLRIYDRVLSVAEIQLLADTRPTTEAKGSGSRAESTVTLRPVVSEELLINPGKGYLISFLMPERVPEKVLRFAAIGYTRYHWCDLEPQERMYNWDLIDQRMAAWQKAGKRFAFGVDLANIHYKGEYVTPKWVFDAGAKPRRVRRPEKRGGLDNIAAATEYRGDQIIPADWKDPVLLDKYYRFIAALAERYDSHTQVVWYEIRSYGNWGEGHLGPWGGVELTAQERYDHHIAPHRQYFRRTPLMAPHQYTCGPKGVEDPKLRVLAAKELGIGCRDDGVMSHRDGSSVAAVAGLAPNSFEWGGMYPELRQNHWNRPGRSYEQCLRNGKVVYCGLGRGGDAEAFIDGEGEAFVTRMANLLGYHIVLTEAVLPVRFTPGRKEEIVFTWRNDGVAPPWFDLHLALVPLDARDQSAKRIWIEGHSLRTLSSGVTTTDRLTVDVPADFPADGPFAFGIFTDRNLASPDVRIAIQGRLADGWYPLRAGE